MGRLRQNLLLLAANLLIILGVLIFMAGYFRARPRMSTEGEVDMQRTASVTSESAPFDKIVFMMIDALRRSEPFITVPPSLLIFSPRISSPPHDTPLYRN